MSFDQQTKTAKPTGSKRYFGNTVDVIESMEGACQLSAFAVLQLQCMNPTAKIFTRRGIGNEGKVVPLLRLVEPASHAMRTNAIAYYQQIKIILRVCVHANANANANAVNCQQSTVNICMHCRNQILFVAVLVFTTP